MPETKNDLKLAYKALFMAPNGTMPEASRMVMKDLMKFCCAATSPTKLSQTGIDVPATFQKIGRNEVWHRINSMLHIPDREVYVIANEPFESRY